MRIGYMRVSTVAQNLDTQKAALESYGVERIFEEKASGRNIERPVLKELLKFIRSGDTLVIYDLSRLGRTVHQVVKLLDDFIKRNIGFVSLKESLDITTPMGKAMAHIIAVFNQMQVDVQNEKTREGLLIAKANGKKLGRKAITQDKILMIQALCKEGYSNQEVADKLGVSRRTVINYKKGSKQIKN
ncbi:recombinase family protein [Candidatus Xianfuyuplasma coldseepsis]|uniref:Recombinase family protein n=1 Tax=Candidatus Xianfuyuplasma coldseepsis TaxID=2782163 RepID=A0A7L7KPX0_9MOLU|nr:recombinase family protein [Xianfuyuplasma coldseepsis]QMS84841.1 recombinase family protein [Xianfuyuplasma coldseepsis]